ncbi:MAG TPA: hypothetical protein VEQ18_00410 [Candidatus Nitrosocosmicus sp.]|nr:hypothetical protein [Candidatus Nitrosocosmicus sp.]
MTDYFEVDRLAEDIAKIYASLLAVSLFKVNKNKNPSKEEFRNAVMDFMKQFQYSLDKFPDTEEGVKFKQHCRELFQRELDIVKTGKNKEVEKRHKYYTEYN